MEVIWNHLLPGLLSVCLTVSAVILGAWCSLLCLQMNGQDEAVGAEVVGPGLPQTLRAASELSTPDAFRCPTAAS